MGFLDTVAKAKAFDDSAKTVAMQNATVAQEVQDAYARNAQAQKLSDMKMQQEALGLAYMAGNKNMPVGSMTNAQTAQDVQQMYGVPTNTGDARFSGGDMMTNLGLAGNSYNQYKGQ